MPPETFLHERSDFKALVETVASSEKINDPALVEKDYWIMHAVFGLKQLGLTSSAAPGGRHMLSVYTRHYPPCQQTDSNYRRCRCPKWINPKSSQLQYGSIARLPVISAASAYEQTQER